MFLIVSTEPVYTFVDNVTGEPVHIAVAPLLEAIKASTYQPALCEIAPSLIQALEAGNLGVEVPHALALPEAALEAPLLVCQWGDAHVIADGAHRLWRRWQRGDTEFMAYMIPERIWRLFVIPNDVLLGDGEFWSDFNRTAQVRH